MALDSKVCQKFLSFVWEWLELEGSMGNTLFDEEYIKIHLIRSFDRYIKENVAYYEAKIIKDNLSNIYQLTQDRYILEFYKKNLEEKIVANHTMN